MKDHVFDGLDVPAALAAAGQALGLDPRNLRHVVLDPGAPGGLGLSARKARIAVLFPGPAAADEPPAQRPPTPSRAPEAPAGVPAAASVADSVRGLFALIAQAAGAELRAEVEETPDALAVRVSGPASDLFLEDDGEILRSCEYLLQLLYRRQIEPRRLVFDCEGYRSRRDHALHEEALRLAAEVAADGVARTTRALNAYERRIVHMALGGHPELQTYSVGEGADRRVTVARRDPAAGDGGA